MPTGQRLTNKQKKEIVRLFEEEWTNEDIAQLMDLGSSTVWRVTKKHLDGTLKMKKLSPRVKPQVRTTISVAATIEDHQIIKEYATEHDLAMHEALHAVLNKDGRTDILDAITALLPAKKKWWHL